MLDDSGVQAGHAMSSAEQGPGGWLGLHKRTRPWDSMRNGVTAEHASRQSSLAAEPRDRRAAGEGGDR